MAEIRIEKKKGVPAWVLLLALVLLALLVWAVLTMRGNRPEPPSDMAVVAWSLSPVPVAPIALAETTRTRCA